MIRSPVRASTSSGNTVPSRTTNAKAANSRLLRRKPVSRLRTASMRPGERSSSPRHATNPHVTTTTSAKKPSRNGPMSDSVKAWTESSTPERVRNVPRIVERERRAHQREVPDAQHPSPLLHHHRVEERGAGQPRQEAGVLDRVPRPVAAPAEDLVAPPGAEHDADGEEAPSDQRPAAGGDEPALAQPAGGEGGDGEGERDGEPDVAEVQHRRVDRHQGVVLQQRVRTGPVEPGRRLEALERVGGAERAAAKKKAATTKIVSRAQPTSGSSRRLRNFAVVATR